MLVDAEKKQHTMFSSGSSTAIFALCILLQVLSSSAVPNSIGSFETGPKIINGTLAERNNTKHQISVRRKLNDSFFFGVGHICGGSLITRSVALSAAHCFVNYDSSELEFLSARNFIAVMGNLDRFENNNYTLSYDISHIVYYVPKINLSTYENDIALLFLTKMVPENHPSVQPILVNRKPFPGGTICQATGWGTTEEGYLAEFLMTVDVPIIPNDVCSTETRFAKGAIRDGMMCAGYMEGEKDACTGDSGGPLVCSNVLTGIVSWGIGCAKPLLPGVYVDVAYYVPWIEFQLKEAGTSLPGAATCLNGSLTQFLLLPFFVLLVKII